MPLYDKEKKEYQFIKVKGLKNIEAYDEMNQFNFIKLEAIQQEKDKFVLQNLYDNFLFSLASELEVLKEDN